MQVRILGSAAGGGFPQWNCACPNCRLARAGNPAFKSRTQAQVAVSANGEAWFLLGASPDLRSQIESCPDLHPRSQRNSPIAGVVLGGADLDHVLGLLLLRELQPLSVYATPSVQTILRGNPVFGMLNRIPRQADWISVSPGKAFSLRAPGAEASGLTCEAISLPGNYPAYVKDSEAALGMREEEAVVGLVVHANGGHSKVGKSLAYFPTAAAISPDLLDRLKSADLLLFDGTFWSDDELIRVQGSGQTARQMGHLPVSGAMGSLELLSRLPMPKVYIHINNTNPMLNQESPEYRQVRDAGWQLAEDRWQGQL